MKSDGVQHNVYVCMRIFSFAIWPRCNHCWNMTSKVFIYFLPHYVRLAGHSFLMLKKVNCVSFPFCCLLVFCWSPTWNPKNCPLIKRGVSWKSPGRGWKILHEQDLAALPLGQETCEKALERPKSAARLPWPWPGFSQHPRDGNTGQTSQI